MIIEKTFSCNSTCGSDCCSEIFLLVNEKQKESFERKKAMFIINNKNMLQYLKLHKSIELNRVNKMLWLLTIKRGIKTKFIHNPHNDKWYLRIDDPCTKLLPDKKCKIYRARPVYCRIAKCPVFENDKSIKWFGHNGKLKEFMKHG